MRVAMHLLFDTALMAPVRGWLARAERLLEGQGETPAHAWFAVVRNYERMLAGDVAGAREWARRAGRPNELAALAGDSDFHRALAAAVDRVNAKLSPIERIRRFAVAPEPFTTDNAMQTPSLKIRRHKIRDRYGETLERLYDKAAG